METNWREIIDLCAKGQQAMTQIDAIKSILAGVEYDHAKLEAICAILGIKKEGGR